MRGGFQVPVAAAATIDAMPSGLVSTWAWPNAEAA
jgi:hypothetical protein